MKTVFYYVLAVCAVLFSACQNDNSVNPRPTEQIVGKATIKGKVKADLNTVSAGLENAPEGTKIIAEISTADLALTTTSGVTYPNKYYEATVTNGEYSIEVEAGPRGTDVTLYFADFRADVTTSTTPVSKVFKGPVAGTFVIKNQVKILDVDYN